MPDVLLLIPTELERRAFMGAWAAEQKITPPALCGFGPIVPAGRTMQLIHEQRPKHICLLGIAGSLSKNAKVGEAYMFSEIVCYGVGVGSGNDFQSASSLGWPQWEDPRIGDSLPAVASKDYLIAGQLITTCSASASQEEAEWKRALYPRAVAEDMEAFAVASACHFAGIGFSCIRGISNVAGQRDKSTWQIDTAMTSATDLFEQLQNWLGLETEESDQRP